MHLVSFGDAIVQYSCAMNTQCIQHSFCNCMFVAGRGGTLAQIRTLVFMPDKEWESGYNHGLLHCATQVVEIWLYSCMYCWLDSFKIFIRLVFMYCFINLEIFMPCKSGYNHGLLFLCQTKWWKSGYNHGLLFLCHTSGGNLAIFMHVLLAGFS